MKTNGGILYLNPEGELLTKALQDSIVYQKSKLTSKENRLRKKTDEILENFRALRGGNARVEFISRSLARQLARHELYIEDTNQTDQWNQYLDDQILGPDVG